MFSRNILAPGYKLTKHLLDLPENKAKGAASREPGDAREEDDYYLLIT